MNNRPLLNHKSLNYTLDRLAHQVFEKHLDLSKVAVIALQPRGVELGRRIVDRLQRLYNTSDIKYGEIDVTFHRDDFRRRDEMLVPSKTNLEFSIEGLNIILVDDVLYTGRTVRSGLDAMLDYGRPAHVELLVLIDRRFSRELPVQPNYTGRKVDVVTDETVKVIWTEDDSKNEVLLFSPEPNND